MEKYSSYKDSGFAWMGQIPSHWETRRFRFLLAENSLQNTDLKERKQLQFKYGDIVPKANQSEEKDVLDTIKKYTVVAPGDIMINGLNLNYDFISQRVAQVQEPGVITSAYVSLRPLEGANSKYYTYYMKAMDAQKMFHGMGSGVRLTLSYDNLKNLFFPYPSPEEQKAIVAYLDAATAKIDEAIAQQQRMIDLLNERKRIIIHSAVTKGLNPAVQLRDSGVSWIGQIPKHWVVKRLKHIARLRSGDTINSDRFTEEGYPVYGGNGFRGYTDSYTNEGDFVLIGRQGALCGNVNYAHGRFFASEHAVVVYPYNTQNVIWLGEVIRDSDLNQYSQSAAQPGLAVSTIGNIYYPYPPDDERDAIASEIKEKSSVLDANIRQAESMISLLQERKQIIINDIVTGKVKVV
jgi:type I restriction enzyme S subunit